MATIPTTDRKYYDTERKVNAMAEYAGELLPAAKQYQDMVFKQEEAKLLTKESLAKLQMNELTQEWRSYNTRDPINEESLLQLQIEYDSILSQYREEIDPVFRNKWDTIGSRLKGQFGLENQKWGFRQRIFNEELDFEERAKATAMNLAYEGSSNPFDNLPTLRKTLQDDLATTYRNVSPKKGVSTIAKQEKTYLENEINKLINSGDAEVAYSLVVAEGNKPPEERSVDDKTLNALLKKTKTAVEQERKTEIKLFLSDVLEGKVTPEEIEEMKKKHPDLANKLAQKKYKEAVAESKPKTKKPDKRDMGDFEKDIDEEFKKNDEAFGFNLSFFKSAWETTKEILTGDKRIQDPERYEELNFLIAQKLCDDINNSNLREEEMAKLKTIVANKVADRNYSDDIDTIVAEYETISNKYGRKDVVLGAVPSMGGNIADISLIRHNLNESVKNYMMKVINEMSNISDREKYLATLTNKSLEELDEFNEIRDQRMEKIQEIQKDFLMTSISNTYGVPLNVLKNLKKGDTFALPTINNVVVRFDGWTTTDMIVDIKRGNQ